MRSLAVLTGVIAYVTLRTLGLGLPARLVPTPDEGLSELKLLFGVAAPAVAGTLLTKLALWRTRRLGAADVRLLLAAGAATSAMLLDTRVKAAVAAGLDVYPDAAAHEQAERLGGLVDPLVAKLPGGRTRRRNFR